jgi:hypothetical protein
VAGGVEVENRYWRVALLHFAILYACSSDAGEGQSRLTSLRSECALPEEYVEAFAVAAYHYEAILERNAESGSSNAKAYLLVWNGTVDLVVSENRAESLSLIFKEILQAAALIGPGASAYALVWSDRTTDIELPGVVRIQIGLAEGPAYEALYLRGQFPEKYVEIGCATNLFPLRTSEKTFTRKNAGLSDSGSWKLMYKVEQD